MPFRYPVSAYEKNLQSYHKLIKNPIDLASIEEKLKNHYYSSGKECLEDVELMFNNTFDYFSENQPIYKAAIALRKYWKGQIKKMPKVEKVEIVDITTVHEGHKDHKCNSCDQSFTDVRLLNAHILMIHTENENGIHTIHEGNNDYILTVHEGHNDNIHDKTNFENINKVKMEMEQELETLRPLKDQLKSSKQLKSELESKLNKLEQNIREKDQMCESLKNEKESLENKLNELQTKSSDSNAQFENIKKVKIEMEQELETLRPLKDQLKTSQQLKSELESKLNKLEQNIQQKDQMWESLKNQKESLEKNLNELLKLKNEQVEVLNLELKSKSEEKCIRTVQEGHKDYKCESCEKSFTKLVIKCDEEEHIHTVHEGHKDNNSAAPKRKRQSSDGNMASKIQVVEAAAAVQALQAVPQIVVPPVAPPPPAVGFTCDICEITYQHRTNLSRHNRQVHRGIKHICPYCGHAAGRSDFLHVHIERVHQ